MCAFSVASLTTLRSAPERSGSGVVTCPTCSSRRSSHIIVYMAPEMLANDFQNRVEFDGFFSELETRPPGVAPKIFITAPCPSVRLCNDECFNRKLSHCAKCGIMMPCGIDSFDVVDALRCPRCGCAVRERALRFLWSQTAVTTKLNKTLG